MKIKVCGMRDPENIKQIVKLQPDFIGFIFYAKSKRFVGHRFPVTPVQLVPGPIKKVGVFVNETISRVINQAQRYGLDYIQLHGGEPLQYCREIRSNGLKTIKVFGVGDTFDFNKIQEFYDGADIFLFDTKTAGFGGSGKKFNWNVVSSLKVNKPFILSGGIGPEDSNELNAFHHPDFTGVDINSRFETKPGYKDINKIKTFIENLKS